MPFNMFKAFSGSRNRVHGDPAIYNDYPQGYPPGTDYQPETVIQSQPRVLRRSSIKRREPVFTPLPSRTPTDAEDYNEGYIRVDSPEAVMGGALNARPAKIDTGLPILGAPAESPVSESLSEREHREHTERLHDAPGLLDRTPQLQRAGSFRSGRGERVDPNEPIVMAPSPSRSSASGSDHTIEALRTPLSMYPSDRVIPPLPRTHSAGYVPSSRSPTDIYGSHPYEVRSHHNSAMYHDRYGRVGGYEKEGPIYYVIPGGMNVIFQDEYGNEITRVGDFSGRSRPSRPGPFVVQDEHGRELYRYDGYDRRSQRGYGGPQSQIIQIDAYRSPGRHRHDRNYSSQSYRSDPAYRRNGNYDYYPDQRGYHGYREKDWRDHGDHRYRGYANYPAYGGYGERSHRDPSRYKDHGGYREHGGYGEHRDHKPQGRSEVYTPSRASSRASHRTYSHSGQMSPERSLQQYPDPTSDDRRAGRDYAGSHASMRHQEDELDITGGLQELQI